jgi:hypothetical protein
MSFPLHATMPDRVPLRTQGEYCRVQIRARRRPPSVHAPAGPGPATA